MIYVKFWNSCCERIQRWIICVHWCRGDLCVDTSVPTGKKKTSSPVSRNCYRTWSKALKSHAQPSISLHSHCLRLNNTHSRRLFCVPNYNYPGSQLSQSLNSLARAVVGVKHHLRLATTDSYLTWHHSHFTVPVTLRDSPGPALLLF